MGGSGFERPKGRMLLYWGCGATPGPGQPVVIDFSKLAAGQMPPDLFTTTIPRIRKVAASNRASYSAWPNAKSSNKPTKDSSLLGPQRNARHDGPGHNFTIAQAYTPSLPTYNTQ